METQKLALEKIDERKRNNVSKVTQRMFRWKGFAMEGTENRFPQRW